MYDSPDAPVPITEQELRQAARRKAGIGILLMFSPVALVVIIYFIQGLVPHMLILSLFFVMFILMMIGLGLVIYFGKDVTLFFHGLEILKLLTPSPLLITPRFAVVTCGQVHAVVFWGSNVVMFFIFGQPKTVPTLKPKIPRTIWTWEYNVSIDDVKVARREGDFTIPTAEDGFITGNGVLYALLVEGKLYSGQTLDFSQDQILQVVDRLNQEFSA